MNDRYSGSFEDEYNEFSLGGFSRELIGRCSVVIFYP